MWLCFSLMFCMRCLRSSYLWLRVLDNLLSLVFRTHCYSSYLWSFSFLLLVISSAFHRVSSIFLRAFDSSICSIYIQLCSLRTSSSIYLLCLTAWPIVLRLSYLPLPDFLKSLLVDLMVDRLSLWDRLGWDCVCFIPLWSECSLELSIIKLLILPSNP